MLSFVKSLFRVPAPSGPTETLAEFKPGSAEPFEEVASIAGTSWKLPIDGPRSIPLFQFSPPEGTESCRLHYRMQVKTDLSSGFVYLELWCNLPGVGKFFSKGLGNKITGTSDWSEHEVPFLLKKGQRPDVLDLNLYGEGQGTVWIKDITILKTPLA